MKVGGKHYFTQVGVGIDALMIRDTKREHKRRFGRLAYLWTALTRLLGFQPRRFLIEVDDRQERRRASQVVVANSGTLGQPPFRWGPDIRPDDGRLDVCIVRARTLLDYLSLAWHVVRGQHGRDPNMRYLHGPAADRHRDPPPAAGAGRRRDHRRDARRGGGRRRGRAGRRAGTGDDRPTTAEASRTATCRRRDRRAAGPLSRTAGGPGAWRWRSGSGPRGRGRGTSSGRRPGRRGRRAGVAGSAPAAPPGGRGSGRRPRPPGRR